MSSLGQVVVGLPRNHNPVNFIYGNISHVSDYIQDHFILLHLYQQQYTPPTSEILEIEAYRFGISDSRFNSKLWFRWKGVAIQKICFVCVTFEIHIKPVDIHEDKSSLMILQNRLPQGQRVRDSRSRRQRSAF